MCATATAICISRNIVEIDGAPVLFDAIEFDDALATIDVLYDLAFLLMDLGARGLRATPMPCSTPISKQAAIPAISSASPRCRCSSPRGR